MTIRIRAVLGDYYHPAEWAEQALQAAVNLLNERRSSSGESAGFELQTVSYESLAEAISDHPELLVIFKEQRVNPEAEDPGEWMHADLQENIVRYVEAGGALLAWHAGLAYQNDGAYRRMLRGWFLHHPEQKTVTYRPAESDHPLSRTEGFAFKDEHYFVHCEEAETNVFLISESEDGRSIAGWSHEYGQGRVCCLTPAHTLEGLQDEGFLKLLADCLEYLL